MNGFFIFRLTRICAQVIINYRHKLSRNKNKKETKKMTDKATATETATEVKDTPKKILVATLSKLVETNVDLVPLFGVELAERLFNFYESIKTQSVRGLPATERLANVEAAIKQHYASAPIANGALDMTSPEFPQWSLTSVQLMQRKARIEREIADGGAHVVKGTGKGKGAGKK